MIQSPELRQQIDDLALRLVVDGAGQDPPAMSDCGAALRRIQEQAVREHAFEAARLAGNLADTLQRGEGVPDLREGIARLQECVSFQPASAAEMKAPAQDTELLADFILETGEHLAAIEAQVLTLEQDPRNSEALHPIFRGFHTIKGLAGFLELWDIQKVAHEVEAILDRARSSGCTLTPAAIDIILESTDFFRRWLVHLEAGLREEAHEAPRLDHVLLDRIHAISAIAGEPAVPGPELAALAEAIASERPAATATPESTPATGVPNGGNHAMAIKVDTAKLDYLVDMAGEMVVAESLVRHDPDLAALKSPRLQRHIAQLTRITGELQKTAMAMRLVPVGPLFSRMGRLVRDLSRQFGKSAQIQTQGDEIELDRTIVEALADPLMHMVRNALDHGIESPAERTKCGKDANAHVTLKAQHHAGHVLIEIGDDGRGLDTERIRNKAVEKGLISASAELSETEIHNLIFEPGFTTAAKLTNVSGRGVGMDVVRRHIEKLRGRIEIRSTPGKGTIFSLKLPLTLAIIDGLVVGVGSERYIVPLFAVRELLRPGAENIWTIQHRTELALVRGKLLPVQRLYRRFRVQPKSEDPQQSVLVIAEVEGRRFGLLVDELIGKQEVVIKSLGETFANLPGIAGGAILGDGRVGLILDLDRLFQERASEPGR